MNEKLTPEELRRIFDQKVRPRLEPLPGTDQQSAPVPHFVSVGGQPGAGKGRVLESMAAALPGAVIVNGDELRRFHPDYEQLMRDDPLRMPEVTASASGPWVGMANEYLRQQRVSAIVETTLRDAAMLRGEFETFKAAGYTTELRVVAVPLEVSREGTVTRYLGQVGRFGAGRWTPGEHHDRAAAAVPETVAALTSSGLVDRVVVQDRDGRVFWDENTSMGGAELGRSAAAAVELARNVETMSPEQASLWLTSVERAVREQTRLGQYDPDLSQVIGRLCTTDASAVVPQAYPDNPRACQKKLVNLRSLGKVSEARGRAAQGTKETPVKSGQKTPQAKIKTTEPRRNLPRPIGRDRKGLGR